MTFRRSILASLLASLLTFGTGLLNGSAQELSAKVHLLGTGGPIPRMDRFGPATLVEVAGMRLLFDAGRGVSQRLWQLGIPLGSIDAVFLTHLHSDHLVGLPDLWLTGWLQPEYGRRQTPLQIYGPTGSKLLAQSLKEGFAADIGYRTDKEGLPAAGIDFAVAEVEPGVTLLERNGVKVSAFEVDHGVVKPAFGFRIEFAGRKIVISGDTRYSENLVAQSMGADLLVHEVVAAAPALAQNPFVQRQFGYHTSPDDLARIFNVVRPKLAVLSHFVLLGNAANPAPDAEQVLQEIRKAGYAGPLLAGRDLLRIDVGSAVDVIEGPLQ